MSEEEFKEYVKETLSNINSKINKKEQGFINLLGNTFNDVCVENEKLKSDIEELNLIVGIRQKRNLIRKFDKEYDEEDKKKNPNRDYACISPDAEVVYERYYQLKSVLKEIREYIKENKDKYYQDWGEDDGSCDTYLDEEEINKLLEIIDKGIGGNNE